MNITERSNFIAYLKALTDAQVRGVLDKETQAGHHEDADLARSELEQRGIYG